MKKSRLQRKKPIPRSAKLKPGGQLKRGRMKPISDKKRKADRAAKPMFKRFIAEKDRCDCCGIHITSCHELQNHHICGGTHGRKHDRRNLLRLCVRFDRPGCHFLVDGASNGWPKLTRAMQLTIKEETDPAFYDREFLVSLYGEGLDEPAPLHAKFKQERIINGWHTLA